MLSFNEVHMTKENTNILGHVWIEGKGRGVKGSKVELAENRLIFGQRSTLLSSTPPHSKWIITFLQFSGNHVLFYNI